MAPYMILIMDIVDILDGEVVSPIREPNNGRAYRKAGELGFI
jgi:hypothetical protein